MVQEKVRVPLVFVSLKSVPGGMHLVAQSCEDPRVGGYRPLYVGGRAYPGYSMQLGDASMSD